jgi:hypothetical protein
MLAPLFAFRNNIGGAMAVCSVVNVGARLQAWIQYTVQKDSN